MKATKKARNACYLLGRADWYSLLGGCRIRCIAGYALIFNGNPASLRLKPLRFESSHPDKVEQTAGEILRFFYCVPKPCMHELGFTIKRTRPSMTGGLLNFVISPREPPGKASRSRLCLRSSQSSHPASEELAPFMPGLDLPCNSGFGSVEGIGKVS